MIYIECDSVCDSYLLEYLCNLLGFGAAIFDLHAVELHIVYIDPQIFALWNLGSKN